MPWPAAPVVAAGLGSVVVDGFFGIALDSAVGDGFFLPQLSQSILGGLKPLLQPGSENSRPRNVSPTNSGRFAGVRMAYSPFD